MSGMKRKPGGRCVGAAVNIASCTVHKPPRSNASEGTSAWYSYEEEGKTAKRKQRKMTKKLEESARAVRGEGKGGKKQRKHTLVQSEKSKVQAEQAPAKKRGYCKPANKQSKKDSGTSKASMEEKVTEAPGDKECDESKGSKEKERETRPRVSLDPKLKNPERNDTVHVYGF